MAMERERESFPVFEPKNFNPTFLSSVSGALPQPFQPATAKIPADSPNRSMGAISRYDEQMDQLRH